MPATDEAVTLAVAAADAADDRRATDLAILEVADILQLVDVFLLATASSDRQLAAVVDRIEERLREEHARRPLRREGTAASGWVLLDFGDLVCHVMNAEQRDYYALERLWGDVPRRDPVSGERRQAAGPAATAALAARGESPADPDPEPADLDPELADLELVDLDAEAADLELEPADPEPDGGP